MTDTINADLDDTLDWSPDDTLIKTLANRATEEYGKSARLTQVASLLDEWPETMNLDLGQQEILIEEIVEVLAARDNGRRS